MVVDNQYFTDGTKQLCNTLTGVCVAQLFHIRSRPNLVQAEGAHNRHGPRKQSEENVKMLFFFEIFYYGLSVMKVIARYPVEVFWY